MVQLTTDQISKLIEAAGAEPAPPGWVWPVIALAFVLLQKPIEAFIEVLKSKSTASIERNKIAEESALTHAGNALSNVEKIQSTALMAIEKCEYITKLAPSAYGGKISQYQHDIMGLVNYPNLFHSDSLQRNVHLALAALASEYNVFKRHLEKLAEELRAIGLMKADGLDSDDLRASLVESKAEFREAYEQFVAAIAAFVDLTRTKGLPTERQLSRRLND